MWATVRALSTSRVPMHALCFSIASQLDCIYRAAAPVSGVKLSDHYPTNQLQTILARVFYIRSLRPIQTYTRSIRTLWGSTFILEIYIMSIPEPTSTQYVPMTLKPTINTNSSQPQWHNSCPSYTHKYQPRTESSPN